jgi:hypothetical protein
MGLILGLVFFLKKIIINPGKQRASAVLIEITTDVELEADRPPTSAKLFCIVSHTVRLIRGGQGAHLRVGAGPLKISLSKILFFSPCF